VLNGPEIPLMVLIVSLATVFVLRGPFGQALAARITGKKGVAADDETTEEVKELRREVDEMRHMTEQMSELGERVDFLERLVAKQREAERLPPVR